VNELLTTALVVDGKGFGSFSWVSGVKPPNWPMISERFHLPCPFMLIKIQKAIRESDFYRRFL
jgi:hypothetical protein